MQVFSLDGVNGIHPVYHAQKDASTILVSQCELSSDRLNSYYHFLL